MIVLVYIQQYITIEIKHTHTDLNFKQVFVIKMKTHTCFISRKDYCRLILVLSMVLYIYIHIQEVTTDVSYNFT